MKTIFSRLPSAFQQSAIYALAIAGTKGISLLMIPVFTNFLSPADYGRLDILQTLADVLSIVIGLGLADTLFRFCGNASEEDRKKIGANLYALSWIIAIAAFIVTQSSAVFIANSLPGDITVAQTRLILASLSLSGTILVPMAWLRLNGRVEIFLVGSLGQTIFQATLAILFLFMGFGVTGFLIAGLIAFVSLSGFLGYVQYKETGLSVSLKAYKKYGAYGGPLIFAGFAGFILGSFDRWILADVIGPALMAQYALAAKFGLITAVLIQPFDMWWHAKRFTIFNELGPRWCAHYASIGVLIACGATLIVCTISPVLIYVMTPVSYHASIQYVPWLVILAALHNMTPTLGFGLYMQNTTKWPAIIDGCAAALALIAYLTLIPMFGAYGAIVATCLALCTRFVVTFVIAQRINYLPYQTLKLVLVILYTLAASLWISFSLTGISQFFFGILAALGLIAVGTLCGFLPRLNLQRLAKP